MGRDDLFAFFKDSDLVNDEEEGSGEMRGAVPLNRKKDLRVANAEEKSFGVLRERGSKEEVEAAGVCEVDIVECAIESGGLIGLAACETGEGR